MRLELVKRPRSGLPVTVAVWFAWCNVRPHDMLFANNVHFMMLAIRRLSCGNDA